MSFSSGPDMVLGIDYATRGFPDVIERTELYQHVPILNIKGGYYESEQLLETKRDHRTPICQRRSSDEKDRWLNI